MRQYIYLKNPATNEIEEHSFAMPIGNIDFNSIALTLHQVGKDTWPVAKAFTAETDSEEVLATRSEFNIAS